MAKRAAPIAIILNPSSGGGGSDITGRLTELFASHGQDIAITEIGEGVSVPDAARKAAASGAPAVVAAGGDGTVNAVASGLVGGEVPLGVLPVGTLNHFAKDLGLPLELDKAVEVIAAGRYKTVDVVEVNDRVFLNNASIGVYPRVVELREQYTEKGVAKWIAAGWAALAVLRRRPFLGVRIESAEGVVVRKTPFVLVGNNEYRMTGLHAASRDSLTDGHLAVYMMKAQRRQSLLRVAWIVLTHGVEQTPELDFICVTEATIETRRRNLQVALDGEIVTLQSPLRFKTLPRALRVLAA